MTSKELDRNGLEETEHMQSIGVALYVMGPGRTIWTISEMNTSSFTEKRGGELSIPIERRKREESLWHNIFRI